MGKPNTDTNLCAYIVYMDLYASHDVLKSIEKSKFEQNPYVRRILEHA